MNITSLFAVLSQCKNLRSATRDICSFVANGDQTFVWKVYRLYRSSGMRPPEWILSAFDDFAINVTALVDNPLDDASKAFAEAVGISPSRTDNLSDLNATEAALEKMRISVVFGWEIRDRLIKQRCKTTNCANHIGSLHGISGGTVRNYAEQIFSMFGWNGDNWAMYFANNLDILLLITFSISFYHPFSASRLKDFGLVLGPSES